MFADDQKPSIPGSSCAAVLPEPKAKPAPARKLASAANFRALVKDEDAFEPAEYVKLPKSGLEVLLRRPRPIAYTLLGVPLPALGTDAARNNIEGEAPAANSDPESDQARAAVWAVALWSKVFVQPRLSRTPGSDEIHPSWILPEDKRFIWDWINGEVEYSGESLSTFPAGAQG